MLMSIFDPFSRPFVFSGSLSRVKFWACLACLSIFQVFLSGFFLQPKFIGIYELINILLLFAYYMPWFVRRMRDSGLHSAFIYWPLFAYIVIFFLEKAFICLQSLSIVLNVILLLVFLYAAICCSLGSNQVSNLRRLSLSDMLILWIDLHKKYWSKSFDFVGTSSRVEYWIPIITQSLISFIFILILGLSLPRPNTGATPHSLLSLVLYLVFIFLLSAILPSIAVGVRRLRDAGKIKYVFLFILNFIPVIGLFSSALAFYMLMQPTALANVLQKEVG
ncbi:DUF805 domain-containing protein [bacterium]|nr:DUF805 domain-containing protein [bacterium]